MHYYFMYTIIERVLDLLAVLAQEKAIASRVYPPFTCCQTIL
jgi:hypothetical protein